MKLAGHQKKRIEDALLDVKGAKLENAFHDVAAAIEQYKLDMSVESADRWYDAEIIDEHTVVLFKPKTRGLRVSERTGRNASPGRIRELALRNYVRSLALVYERAKGKRLGRTYDPYANKSKKHRFLLACFNYAGVSRYPHGIIRDVLRELHPNAKRGRPKKLK